MSLLNTNLIDENTNNEYVNIKTINMKDDNGYGLIHLALKEKNEDIALLIINNIYFDPNVQDKNGLTALHYCAILNLKRCIIKLLINPKINTNILDNEFRSAFWYAVKNNNLCMVEILLAYSKFVYIESERESLYYRTECVHCLISRLQDNSIRKLIYDYLYCAWVVKHNLKLCLGYPRDYVIYTYLLVISQYEGYLRIKKQNFFIKLFTGNNKKTGYAKRFFNIMNKLNNDVQMIICNFVYYSNNEIVSENEINNKKHLFISYYY